MRKLHAALAVLVLVAVAGLLTVAAQGTGGGQPRLELLVSPVTLDYNGTEETRTATVTYTGPVGTSIRLRTAILMGGYSAYFRITSENCNGTVLIPDPSSECQIQIRLIRRGAGGSVQARAREDKTTGYLWAENSLFP